MAAGGERAPRRARSGGGVEALLREVLVNQAAQEARFSDLANQVAETRDDARQARDLGNKISTILEEQNIIARFDSHKADMRQLVAELRQDTVASYTRARTEAEGIETKLKGDLATLAGRVAALEADLQRREGIKSFAGWLMKHAPWLFTALMAFAAGLGFKEKIG